MAFGMRGKEKEHIEFIVELFNGNLLENKIILIKFVGDFSTESTSIDFKFDKEELVKLSNVFNQLPS